MKTNRKTHWLRNTLLILAGCAIIGLILSGVMFARDHNRTYVTANLSFTFDGAQDGIAPNGYAFDVNEISSENVLTEALINASMDGRYTFEDLQPNLAVQGIYPEDLISQMTRYSSVTDASSNQMLTLSEYHPTVFNIVLYKDFDPSISKNDLVILLDSILQSYRNWFAQVYAMGSIDEIKVESIEDYDYFQQLEMLQFKLQQAAGYSDEMAGKAPTLQMNGKGFSDMSLLFNTMNSSDLNRLSATMTMNALSKDLDRLQGQYELEIQELESQVTIKTTLMNNLDTLLSIYGKSGIIYLSTSDALNKVDWVSSTIYDNLVDIRNGVSDEIASLNTQITNYKNKLQELHVGEVAAAKEEKEDKAEETSEKKDSVIEQKETDATESYEGLLSDASTEQKKELLENGINRLVTKCNNAISTLKVLVGTFNEQEINDFSVVQSSVRYKAPSIISGSFITVAIKTVGPICALGLILALVLIIINKRKERQI